ncbi:MAG: DUF4197 domain-containing protein [Paludibacteraceae bacterium]
MKKVFTISLIAIFLVSCAELLSVANQVASTATSSTGVTQQETALGLKSALNVGIESAVKKLGITDGFYNDALLKIILPDEAQAIVKNVKLIPGGTDLVNKAVLSMNRAAEDAVKEATPIFKNAILNMSFSDAMGILFGDQNAATNYLKKTTYTQLQNAFAPKIKASLDKPLVLNTSTTKTWNSLTSAYNTVANNPVGSIAGLKPVNVNLEQYVTGKALDALFVKVAEQEKAIRTNPAERATTLLQRVFGQLDKK